MKKDLLKEKLDEAASRLTLAEEALEAAMNALEPARRAEKTIASQVLEEAFTKIRAARAEVKRLGTVIEDEDIPED